MKNLNLERALVGFDLETTGIDFDKDRIVQIALVRVEPDGRRSTFKTLVDPERPIPPQATAIHGIRDEDVAGAPTFARIRNEVEEMLKDADLAGFNSIRFDLPLLQAEVRRAGGMLDLRGVRHLDAMRIFHAKEPRDLTAACRFYCDRDLTGAHDALADVTATLEVLDAQLARYADLPREAAGLHAFCNPDEGKFLDVHRKLAWNDQGEAVLTFGKFQGRTLQQICALPDGRGYLEWVLGKDFGEDLKAILREALGGVFPRREGSGDE